MGWYIRKSFSFGPLRLNLSKSGLGYSFGVKGARIGTGPRGNYIHMGRYGVYYRQNFNPPTQSDSTPTSPSPTSRYESITTGTIIPTADVSQLTDISAEDLLTYIRAQHSKLAVAPWVLACAGLILVIMIGLQIELWIVVCCSVLSVLAYVLIRRFDMGRKRVTLHYELDESADAKYKALLHAIESLHSSQRMWRVITRDPSVDPKYSAGAGLIINRQTAAVELGPPRNFQVDLPLWRLGLGSQSLYLLPDRILVYQGSDIGTVPYSDLTSTHSMTQYVESDGVPSDARVVGTTWRYANKRGGPDRRFANNPQIPVVLYGEVLLRSRSGLQVVLQCSNAEESQKFAQGLSGYCSTMSAASLDESSAVRTSSMPKPLEESAIEGWGWAAAPLLFVVMVLALLLGPRGFYLQATPALDTTARQDAKPLPDTRVLRQKGMQIVLAVPAATTDLDLVRVLDHIRAKLGSSELSDLGVQMPEGALPPNGAIFLFRTDSSAVPGPLGQSDAILKWSPKTITATLRKADGTRVPAFASTAQ